MLFPVQTCCSSRTQSASVSPSPLGQGWVVPAGASLARQAHALTPLSLLTPDSHGRLGALRRGNLWMLAMDRSPQVKIKYSDYPARFPTPLPVG